MNDISKLMRDSLPADPSTTGWAEGVRNRRRRRGQFIAGFACLLAIGLAIPLGAALFAKPPQLAVPAAPEGSDQLPSRSRAEVCGPLREQLGQTDSSPGSPLRAGAVRIWLCGDAKEGELGESLGRTLGPAWPITAGIEELFTLFQTAEELDPMTACTDEYRLSYTIGFEYPDGSVAPLRGELHGCRTVTDGDTVRVGGQELYDHAVKLWNESEPDRQLELPDSCNAVSMLAFKLDQAARLVECVTEPDGGVTQQGISNRVLQLAVNSLAEDVAPVGSENLEFPLDKTTVLQLTDARGSVLNLEMLSDGRYHYLLGEQEMLWTPNDEVRAALAKLDG